MLGGAELAVGTLVYEGLAAAPAVAAWTRVALEWAAAGESSDSAVVAGNDGPLRASATALPLDGVSAVVLSFSRAALRGDVAPADVSRKTWHDIQNQLGGLKLYATFLKRKLGEADAQLRETADKIVSGIDAVAQSISDARRGQEGTRDEKGQSHTGR